MFVYEIYLYIIVGHKRDILICCISTHYWRPRLCRVFLHSAKSPLHSAKALPSVALGKVRSAKFFSANGLCRVLFIRALGKIKKNCRVFGVALGKIFSAVAAPAVNDYFAECPTQYSPNLFLFFLKITLPSAPAQALGKVFFLKNLEILCRVPKQGHSTKKLFKKNKKKLC